MCHKSAMTGEYVRYFSEKSQEMHISLARSAAIFGIYLLLQNESR